MPDESKTTDGLEEEQGQFGHQGTAIPSTELKLRVFGQRESMAAAKADRSVARTGITISTKQSIRLSATRSAGEAQTLAIGASDVLAIETEDGARIFIRGDEVPATLKGSIKQERGDELPILEAELASSGTERGLVKWGIKALRVLGIDLPQGEAVAEHAARLIAGELEARVVPQPGLYRWDGKPINENEDRKPITRPLRAGDKPWLIFLHGTFSHAGGSFGDLAANHELWRQLGDRYGERILAFEHESLTKSPIENARDLMRLVPEGATLHLVSHSRGGLVGELLCRGHLCKRNDDGSLTDLAAAFDEIDLGLFGDDKDRARDRAALEEFNRLLTTRKPVVERFVRVASPARGTTLASQKFDRWLNMVFNVIALGAGRVPYLGEAFDLLQDLVVTIVEQKADASVLPGLEAMTPDLSPVLKVSNRPGILSRADLSSVKGDIQPTGVMQRLGVWFSDVFFGDDHDLVVDTGSMDGGLERTEPREPFFDKGSEVNHFSYFRNARTAEVIVDRLLSDGHGGRGFEPLAEEDLQRGLAMPTLTPRGTTNRPIVYILPGITGSHLKVRDKRAWINLPWLAMGAMRKLAITNVEVSGDEPVGLYYGKIARFLDRTHEVRPWGYDWRLSLETTGERFAEELEDALSSSDQPVRILAHSMGGLVARTALRRNDLFERFKSRAGSRLLMLGTPNGGSFSIPLMLTARNSLMGYLALVDFFCEKKDHMQIVSRFSGALELLPEDDPGFFTPQRWDELHEIDPGKGDWVVPDPGDLRRARDFLAELKSKAPFDPDCMAYIAGQAVTIDKVVIDRAHPDRILFNQTLEGDGQVLWKTGIPDGIPHWFVPAEHGDLPRHEDAFDAIGEILETGTTNRLGTSPSALTRGKEVPPPIPRVAPRVYPSEAELMMAAMGGTRHRAAADTAPRIAITVVNNDLSFAEHPVLVGHYRGDTLAGTEAQLDRALNGRLRQRYNLGLYPGALGTCDVVLESTRPALEPPGGVVVGLGNVTELQPGSLRKAIARGLCQLGMAMEEVDRGEADGARRVRGVCSVLVGSGNGGLEINDAVRSILLGMIDAQERLKAEKIDLFTELQIVELEERRAILIWKALDNALSLSGFKGRFLLAPEVRIGEGASRQLVSAAYRDWWRPVQITESERSDGAKVLNFTSIMGSTRAEAQVVPDNRAFADMFINNAIASTPDGSGAATASRALFELLWPSELKDYSSDDSNIRLILDQNTARIPWELMDDRRPWAGDDFAVRTSERKPPAVRFGVLRQLVSQDYATPAQRTLLNRKALVIGDPRGGTPAEEFSRLPGAESEARVVAEVLKEHGYQVTMLIGEEATPEAVVRHLYNDAWTIVHIAAHGIVDYAFKSDRRKSGDSARKQTGIVLGDGLVLGTSVLHQLPLPPEIAFINCCNLGQIDAGQEDRFMREKRPELAASVAVKFIEMGAKGVIAAGWEVDDAAAEVFARTLYDRLVRNETFGTAVREARAATYDENPRTNTWGAYQCYGDPDWRIDPRGNRTTHRETRRYAAKSEALAELASLTSKAGVGRGRQTEILIEDLRGIEAAIVNRDWLGDAMICEALARAFAALGQFEPAIRSYKQAAEIEQADVSLRAIEQLANLRSRHALATLKDTPATSRREYDKARKHAIEESDKAVAAMTTLIEHVGVTVERLNLIASAHKRRAEIEEGAARTAALEKMTARYHEAANLARERKQQDAYYPMVNAITGDIILGLRKGSTRSAIAAKKQALAQVVKDIKALDAASRSFFSEAAHHDIGVAEALAEGKLEETMIEETAKAYGNLWTRRGDARRMASVTGQIRFLTSMLEDIEDKSEPVAEARKALIAALDTIATKVEAIAAEKEGGTTARH